MGGDANSLVRLGNVCLKIGSGATPRGGASVYEDNAKFALIRSQNVYNEGFFHDGLAFIGHELANQLSNVIVEPNDVLLNITGDSVARCCMVDNTVLPARVNQHVAIVRPDPTILDPFFLRYYLISPSMQLKLLSWAGSGGTRKALTKGMIEALEISVPSTEEQRAIAAVLGAFDDKIELNRRMNATLEAMARALFKSWFVDFDPVRAKMEGRPTGLLPEIDALFPDALVDSAVGEIPRGWEVIGFGDLLLDNIGGDWGKEEPDHNHTEAVAIVRGTDIPELRVGGVGKVPTRYTTSKKLERRRLKDGDIVIEVSGGSPTQPTGRSMLIHQSTLDRFPNEVVCASFCRRFRPIDRETGTFAALHLEYLYESGGTWEYQHQSTGIANFQTTHFLETEQVAKPPNAIQITFHQLTDPLLRKVAGNQSLTLSALRDLLLPKLMSGEVRLAEL
jgi:type I restriction enzyme S subunit